MLPILCIVLLCTSCVLCQPSGYHYDPNTPPIEYTTPSPGFNTFATLPEQALDASGDFIDPSLNLNYGVWDDEINAHILDPVHPHAVGLPFPTSRSRECARVKEKVRQKKAGVEALLPWIHESLHESVIAPSISAPSGNNRWYENEFGQRGEEDQGDNFHDADDGEEVDQQTQQAFHDLDNQTQGSFYEASRSTFRHEQGIGGMLDALPSHLLQDDDSGRRSSVHFENYAGGEGEYQPLMYGDPNAGGMIGFGSGQPSYPMPYNDPSQQQQILAQDLLASFGQTGFAQTPLPPRPVRGGRRGKLEEERLRLERQSVEALLDAATMNAWEIYKHAMSASSSEPNLDDALWKRFVKYKTSAIIDALNTGHPESVAQAKMELAAQNATYTTTDNYGVAEKATWSEYTRQNYDKGEYQRLTLKCCQLNQVNANDRSARKYWLNRLLTRGKKEIMDALKSGVLEAQQWAMGQLAGQSFLDAQLRRERAAAAAFVQRASGSRRQ